MSNIVLVNIISNHFVPTIFFFIFFMHFIGLFYKRVGT